MTQLTEAQRLKIVTEHQRGSSIRLVARSLCLSVNTVRKWISRFSQHGTVRSMKQKGRPPLMSAAAGAEAVRRLLAPQAGGAKAVAAALHDAGFTSKRVSRATVTRAAKASARAAGQPIHVIRGLPKKALTPSTMAARLSWAKEHHKTNWHHVMFTDRKRFEFKYPGVKISKCQWVVRGARHEQCKVNHAQGLNIYAGLTPYGLTTAHIVTGTSSHKTLYTNKKGQPSRNITSSEYEVVMSKTLLPEGNKMFSANGISSWTFQQDNDPTHRSGHLHIAAWNKKRGGAVKFMAWPPNSPDLSLIENIWAFVDAKVQAKGCNSFKEFKEAVLEELKNVPKDVVRSLYGSMSKRIAAVVLEKGGKTKY